MLDFSGYKADVEWDKLYDVVLNMQHAFSGKGMVFKTNFAVNFLEQFADTFKNALFVYIKRDPLDVACSILKARMQYFNDCGQWWATYPENYERLKALPYQEQIVEQVMSLERLYDKKIGRISPDRALSITYNELCDDPQGFTATVQAKIKASSGYDLEVVNKAPEKFTFRKKEHLNEEEKALERLLMQRKGLQA
jgi:hypothetical protein